MYHSPTIPVAKSPASSPVNARRTTPLLRKLTTGQLHPLDVYTRASSKFWEDYEGNWQKAFDDTPCFTGRRISAENLLKFSDNRSDAWWSTQRCEVVEGGIIPDATVGTHASYEANKPVVHLDEEMTSTIIASPGASNYVDLSCSCWSASWVPTFVCNATFNMATLEITELVNCTAAITDNGDGTFKCSITYTIPAGTDTSQVRQSQVQACSDTGNNWFGGDGVSVYCTVHDSYLRRSSVPDVYLKTTDAYKLVQSPYDTDGPLLPNLKGLYLHPYQMINETEYSDMSNPLGWVGSNATAVADGTIKNLPAYLVTNTNGGTTSRMSLLNSPITSGNTYCYWTYVTESDSDQVRITSYGSSGLYQPGIIFTLSTLTVGTPATTGCSSVTGTIEEVSTGVYRIAMTVVASVTFTSSDNSGLVVYGILNGTARFTPMQKPKAYALNHTSTVTVPSVCVLLMFTNRMELIGSRMLRGICRLIGILVLTEMQRHMGNCSPLGALLP